MRKTSFLLLLLPLVLQCTRYNVPPTAASNNPCDQSGGVGHSSPNALVCIDAGITRVNPDTVTVKGNSRVDFYIVGGVGELDIQFTAATPVNQLRPDGAHFSAHAKAVSSSSSNKYTVIDRSTGKSIDPTVIIEP
jgi:hypothetical protein